MNLGCQMHKGIRMESGGKKSPGLGCGGCDISGVEGTNATASASLTGFWKFHP